MPIDWAKVISFRARGTKIRGGLGKFGGPGAQNKGGPRPPRPPPAADPLGEILFPEDTFKSATHEKCILTAIYFTTDYTEDSGVARIAGDEYLFEGPGTYMPRKEVSVVATENATVVYANEALKVFSLAELDKRIVLVDV